MFKAIRTVVYKVNDLEKAKLWYTDLLGEAPYFDQPFYVGFNIAGYELGLHPHEKSNIEKSDSVLMYWGVANVEFEYNRMIELGATSHEKPTNVGGEIVVASVKDAWGNIIGLICNPEFSLPKD